MLSFVTNDNLFEISYSKKTLYICKTNLRELKQKQKKIFKTS